MLTNLPMTDKQVKDGECGGKIIPHNAKKFLKESIFMNFMQNQNMKKMENIFNIILAI